MIGPMPAARDITAPNAPKARPRRSAGSSRRNKASVAGTTTAPPVAINTREHASNSRFGAR